MTLITTPSDPAANSYASASDLTTYYATALPSAVAEFATIHSADYEGLLRTATAILDGSYQWLGRRTAYTTQRLEWPRMWVHREGFWAPEPTANAYFDPDYFYLVAYFDAFSYPEFLVGATCELARTLATKDTRADDDAVNLKSVRVGSIAIENNIALPKALGGVSFIPTGVDLLCRRYGHYVPGMNAQNSMMDVVGSY